MLSKLIYVHTVSKSFLLCKSKTFSDIFSVIVIVIRNMVFQQIPIEDSHPWHFWISVCEDKKSPQKTKERKLVKIKITTMTSGTKNQVMLTFDYKFSWTLCMAQSVDSNNLIFTTVVWPDSENVHGAHSIRIGEIKVVVRVDADIIQVPGDCRCWASSNSTCHENLITFRGCVDLQRDQDGWWPLKADVHCICSICCNLDFNGEKRERNGNGLNSISDHIDHCAIKSPEITLGPLYMCVFSVVLSKTTNLTSR